MKYLIYKNIAIEKVKHILKGKVRLELPYPVDNLVTLVIFREKIITSKTIIKTIKRELKIEQPKVIFVAKHFTLEALELLKSNNAIVISYGNECLNYNDNDFDEINVLIGSKVKTPDVRDRIFINKT
jgi:hypothetical protein